MYTQAEQELYISQAKKFSNLEGLTNDGQEVTIQDLFTNAYPEFTVLERQYSPSQQTNELIDTVLLYQQLALTSPWTTASSTNFDKRNIELWHNFIQSFNERESSLGLVDLQVMINLLNIDNPQILSGVYNRLEELKQLDEITPEDAGITLARHMPTDVITPGSIEILQEMVLAVAAYNLTANFGPDQIAQANQLLTEASNNLQDATSLSYQRTDNVLDSITNSYQTIANDLEASPVVASLLRDDSDFGLFKFAFCRFRNYSR